VTVTPDGKSLLIGSGKGLGTGPNHVIRPTDDKTPPMFAHRQQPAGSMSFVETPSKDTLAGYTKQVRELAVSRRDAGEG
jgi:hypothetical protein